MDGPRATGPALRTGNYGVIFSLTLYLIGLEIYANWWMGILILALIVVMMVVGGLAARKANGGLLSYKDSLISVYTVFAVASVLITVFNIVLYNFINTDLAQDVTDITIKNTIIMMEKWNLPEAQIEESIVEMEKIPEQFSISGQLLQFAKGLVIWFIQVMDSNGS